MKQAIIAIGTLKNRPEKYLFDTFYQRLIPPPAIHEILPKVNSSTLQEAQLMLNLIKDDDYVISLDENGMQLSTREFSTWLTRIEGQTRRCVFIIGGANGLDNAVKHRAQLCLSLSKMTWSHLLARALLIEQLYRHQQIKIGHPYHRD